MSSEKPLIVVTGATGTQGGSVVRYLLQDGGFRVRGITRNVDAPKAKELKEKGVEVVKADLDDRDSITQALKGAHGVFGVTNFWEGADKDKEIKQGKLLVDAAKAVGVKHFVWSTLDHTNNPPVVHWNSKAVVDDYLKESGVPRTSLYTTFYTENFLNSFKVTKAADGTLEANWPLLQSDGPIPMYAVNETGAYVLEAFKKPESWIGKDMRIVHDIVTAQKFFEALKEISGKNIKYVEISVEAFDKFQHVPGMEDLWANMKFFYNNNGEINRDAELARRINPQLQTYRKFIEANLGGLIPN